MAIVLFVSLLLGVQATCPTVTCASLMPNMCAQQLSASALQLNADGCWDDYECYIGDYVNWVALTELTTVTLSCVPETPTPEPSMDVYNWPCLEREYNKEFASGEARVLCMQDSDCVTTDGSYESGACVCVPRSDAMGVCRPSPSNQDIFAEYWADCARYGTNSITDSAAYSYWAYALQNWVYAQSDLFCMGVFSELEIMEDLREEYQAAALLAATAVLLLA